MPLTHWQAWLGIACGGALGACARHAVSVVAASAPIGAGRLPLATLAVNLIGCLVAGFVSTWLAGRGGMVGAPHVMLTVGFLGAFTTFSAFSVETLRLFESGALSAALLNALANLLGALAAVALGATLARLAS